MVVPAERHSEFVADLAAERSWLGKFQMMGGDAVWLGGADWPVR